MMPPIFVINLKRSVARKEHMTRQLDDLGVEYSLFEAIEGTEDHPLFSRYDDSATQRYFARSLSQGQLGCYASHYTVWEMCVALGKPIIVLEDDALIDRERFLDFVNNAASLDERYGCIRLFDCMYRRYKKQLAGRCGQLDLYCFSKGHMRATGYYLQPTAAKNFLAHSQRWRMPVDIYMDRYWLNEVRCYGTVPACLSNDTQFDSDIGYSPKPKRPLHHTLRRESLRALEQIKKLGYDLSR